jgi:hypothetical protein
MAPVRAVLGQWMRLKRVARRVFADARRVGRDVVGPPPEAAFTGKIRGRRLEVGEIDHLRVHEELFRAAELPRTAEKAEGVAAHDAERAPVEKAPAHERRVQQPASRSARRNYDHSPRVMPRHRARVLNFQPELGEDAGVANFDDLLRFLAYLRAGCPAVYLGAETARVVPGKNPAHGDDEREHIGEPEEQPEPGPRRNHDRANQQDHEERERAMVRAKQESQEASHRGRPLCPGSRAGYGHAIEAGGDDIGRCRALHLGAGAQDHAVPERHQRQVLHVVRASRSRVIPSAPSPAPCGRAPANRGGWRRGRRIRVLASHSQAPRCSP